MDLPEFRTARGRVAAELRMFKLEIGEMGLDADTAEFLSDRVSNLIAQLDQVERENELNRIESDLGRLQVVVHQALKRGRDERIGAGSGGGTGSRKGAA